VYGGKTYTRVSCANTMSNAEHTLNRMKQHYCDPDGSRYHWIIKPFKVGKSVDPAYSDEKGYRYVIFRRKKE